jgi:hypothetical protein
LQWGRNWSNQNKDNSTDEVVRKGSEDRRIFFYGNQWYRSP